MTATAETAGFTLLRIKRKRNEEPLEGLGARVTFR